MEINGCLATQPLLSVPLTWALCCPDDRLSDAPECPFSPSGTTCLTCAPVLRQNVVVVPIENLFSCEDYPAPAYACLAHFIFFRNLPVLLIHHRPKFCRCQSSCFRSSVRYLHDQELLQVLVPSVTECSPAAAELMHHVCMQKSFELPSETHPQNLC